MGTVSPEDSSASKSKRMFVLKTNLSNALTNLVRGLLMNVQLRVFSKEEIWLMLVVQPACLSDARMGLVLPVWITAK